jgi:hypothetical protein
MRTWRVQPGERSELYCPIGLRLLDEMTGERPIGRVEAFLDVRDGAAWRATEIRPVHTPGGVLAYPGLERRRDASGPPRRYRVRITADFYRPVYPRRPFDGIRFLAFPWNDTNPPRRITRFPQDLKLTPAPGYPFPPFVPVLRGRVVDPAGKPVADADVTFSNLVQVLSRVLSDERGEFALPLQLAVFGVAFPIEAEHRPTGRRGTLNVTLPDDLGKSQTISIS